MGEVNALQYGVETRLEEDNFTARIYIDHHNKRIKLIDFDGEVNQLQGYLFKLCGKFDLSKIICTIMEEWLNNFIDAGYIAEGIIDGFFRGQKGYCISYFTDKSRALSDSSKEEDLIIKKVREMKGSYISGQDSFNIRTASEHDSKNMANLFAEVFKTYPTPMNDPEYIRKVMNKQVLFKVAFIDNKLVSVASADMDTNMLNAEITDCATLKGFRGRGLLSELVYHLEQELRSKKFTTLYSLSRALSFGINMVLSKHGYDYTGRLVNNCNIMGKFEDMNIWVKKL